ncbi:GCG_CRPN prefix-to-repeats domain-containing protein [Methylocystis sp. JAN1]|uniref:GCG_CRPN prefix-to-repeats domain-containing protein n=1 Tax=Methylocystis sp. JAN1 TaxID=3397211 RepID=UPI003FA1D74A
MIPKPLIGAAAFGVFTALPLAFDAAQAAMPVPAPPSEQGLIVQVWGGCGPYGHRGPWGGCRAGGQWGGYYRPYYRPRPFYGHRYWGPRRYYW